MSDPFDPNAGVPAEGAKEKGAYLMLYDPSSTMGDVMKRCYEQMENLLNRDLNLKLPEGSFEMTVRIDRSQPQHMISMDFDLSTPQ
jgi:hypothetical protein